jgi:hypothetical protein
MNTLSELRSKLTTTPRRAAIEYITSIHQRTEAEGMKVLVQRIAEMRATIEKLDNLSRIFNANAFAQTCFFIELYCVAVSELCAALTSLMELNTLVSTYCNFRSSPCSTLYDWMAPEYNSVQILFGAVSLIQDTHLQAWILPQHYGVLTESQVKRCELLRACVADDPAQAGSGLYQPEEAFGTEDSQMEAYTSVNGSRSDLAAEHARMADYISVIGGRVTLENVSLSGIQLTHAEQQMFLKYSKHKQFAELLAIQRGDTIARHHYLSNEDIEGPCPNDQ